MARRKLKHFEEMKEWGHVLEAPRAWGGAGEGASIEGGAVAILPGSWGSPVVLELGCGGGDYTVALGERLPGTMVVGMDMKGARLWHGARRALERGLTNVRFLRGRIEDLALCFVLGEVDEIWIPFPDPHPTKGNAKRRLTSPRFSDIYKQILKPGGVLHLKTDNAALFEYSVETLQEAGFEAIRLVRDVYGTPEGEDLRAVQTAYEKKYLKEGRVILYGEWTFAYISRTRPA